MQMCVKIWEWLIQLMNARLVLQTLFFLTCSKCASHVELKTAKNVQYCNHLLLYLAIFHLHAHLQPNTACAWIVGAGPVWLLRDDFQRTLKNHLQNKREAKTLLVSPLPERMASLQIMRSFNSSGRTSDVKQVDKCINNYVVWGLPNISPQISLALISPKLILTK